MLSVSLLKNYFPTAKLINEEYQNQEYEGILFQDDQYSYRSRLAKKTEKKVGYFVVFWEKDPTNKNRAYSYEQAPDFTLVWVVDDQHLGYFRFPKQLLKEKKILRDSRQPGKMAIRVYPTWSTSLNPTAQRTQRWQLDYFVEVTNI